MDKKNIFKNRYGNKLHIELKRITKLNKQINSYNINHQTKAVVYMSKQIYSLIKGISDLKNELPRLVYNDILWFWGSLSLIGDLLSEYISAEKMQIQNGNDINEFLNLVFSTEKILNIVIANYSDIYDRLATLLSPMKRKKIDVTSYIIKYKKEIPFPDKSIRTNNIYNIINAIYEL